MAAWRCARRAISSTCTRLPRAGRRRLRVPRIQRRGRFCLCFALLLCFVACCALLLSHKLRYRCRSCDERPRRSDRTTNRRPTIYLTAHIPPTHTRTTCSALSPPSSIQHTQTRIPSQERPRQPAPPLGRLLSRAPGSHGSLVGGLPRSGESHQQLRQSRPTLCRLEEGTPGCRKAPPQGIPRGRRPKEQSR